LELEAPFYRVQEVADTEFVSENLQGQVFKVQTHKENYGLLRLPFLGEHQLTNAALALVAAEILQEKGWRISKETIASGLAASSWPGRLEPVSAEPLVILDGAHNTAGMEALSKWLHRNRPKYNRVILVIGMLDDKEREKAAGFLKPLVSEVIITRPNSPRSQKWQMLARVFEGGDSPLTLSESIDEALKLALKAASREDLVLITGSLYLVGDARKILLKG
jgi:dihydrofolate synthase/folylpolyglutamate synthase